jgi:hypothetical protein
MKSMLQTYFTSRKARAIWSFIIVFGITFFLSLRLTDPDFGWHLQAGKYILAHGIPYYDIFSYTAPHFPWVNAEWLHDVFIALLYNIGGWILVAIVFSLIWTSGMILASRLFDVSIILISFISIIDFVMVRPSAWALFFVAIIERILEQTKKHLFYLLPFIIMLWANLHGSFLVGLVFIVFYKIVRKTPIPWTIIIACFAATFINPYGPHLYHEVFSIVGDSKLHYRINEWRPLSYPNFFFISGAILIGMFFAVQKDLRKIKYLLPVFLVLASISSVRYYLIFMAGTVRFFEEAFEKLKHQIVELHNRWTMLYFVVLITLSIVCIGLYKDSKAQTPLPEKAAAYLGINGCSGNIFNFYDFGGFLLGKNPEQRLFIDGRMPSWKYNGIDIFDLYEKTYASSTVREKVFKEYNITCVVAGKSRPDIILELTAQGWQTVIDEPNSVLLEQK